MQKISDSLRPLTEAGEPLSERLHQLQCTVEGILGSSDYQPTVELRHAEGNNRKVRADSTQAYDLDDVVLQISFRRRQADVDRVTALLVAGLERAESRRNFVSLKWFRDKFLPETNEIFSKAEVSSETLTDLIERGLVTVGSVPNPDPAKPHTTTINLNHRHRAVRAALEQPTQVSTRNSGSRFRPRLLKGAPLSTTVLADRR